MSNSDVVGLDRLELGMFLAFSGQSDGINRHSSLSLVDWWSQIGLGGSGTCVGQCPLGGVWCEYDRGWGVW